MQVIWSQAAESDLEGILQYFTEQQDQDTGIKIVRRLFSATDRLCIFPHSGRISIVKNYRELIIPGLPWFVVYKITDKVEILRIIHTSRLWKN